MKTKELLLFFFVFGYSIPNTFASTPIPGGNVFGHWIQANSPYNILGNITVPQDSLLLIDPGVVIEFQGHYELHVNGRIQALGTVSDTITFTALTNWWGFRFDGIQSTQDSSQFIYCIIEKGSANGTGHYGNGGAFFISNFSKVRIQNNNLRNNYAYLNGGSFYCDHASPLIIGNLIRNNTSYFLTGGIYCTYSSPSIINNIISYNDGGIYCTYSNPSAIGNTISHNGGNPGIYCDHSSPSIINNIISHNSMGMYVDNSSPDIIGNLITNNTSAGTDYGAGIRCRFSSSPRIFNNTIANNIANLYGGGLYTDYSSSPIVKNTILWGNTAGTSGSQLALNQTSFPTFYNCDVQGGATMFYYYDAPNTFSGTYINNIDLDPLFVDATNENYFLQASSTCIDAGDSAAINLPLTDLTGNSRICNHIVDIGAYEICSVDVQNLSLENNRINIYPNPFNDKLNILLKENNQTEIILFDLSLRKCLQQTFTNSTTISSEQLANGIYIYEIRNKIGEFSTGKVIKQ
jgi:parallel beta-helix repeat protein